MTQASVAQEIARLESIRTSALVSGDIATLEALVSDDLVHVHGTGQVDGKAEYLEGLRKKYTFHRVERGALTIRVYGDVALVTGPLEQSVSVNGNDKINQISAIVTQAWVRNLNGWQQNTCHMGFISMA